MRLKEWKKGSFTVEAAFLVPAAVMITALLMICVFYVHNQVWYETAALEAALDGNGRMEGSGRTPEETARAKALERAEQQIMPGSVPSLSVSDSGEGTYVGYSGRMFSLFSGFYFSCTAEAEVSRVRPAKYLRTVWMLEEMGQAVESAVS